MSANEKSQIVSQLRQEFLVLLDKCKASTGLTDKQIANGINESGVRCTSGYISKIRSGQKNPSKQLVGALKLLFPDGTSDKKADKANPLPAFRYRDVCVEYDPESLGSIEKAGEQFRITISSFFGGAAGNLLKKLSVEALTLPSKSSQGPSTSASTSE